MKTFTITKVGLDRDGFCWGVEGELALPSLMVCDSNCGCERSFFGLNSAAASTNVMVRDIALDLDGAAEAFYGQLENSGWLEVIDGDESVVRGKAEQFVTDAISEAENFATGTVLRVAYDRDTDEWTFHPVEVA